jgi:hypothetical protein
MSRGSFTSADIRRAHVTMEIVGLVADSVDWSEYLALVELLADPPLSDPNTFRNLALKLCEVVEEWDRVRELLAEEISAQNIRS